MFKTGFKWLTLCMILLATAAVLHSLGFKDVVNSLTTDKKHFTQNNTANSQGSTVINQDEQYRGRAQETRPDISVPPPPGATQVPQAPTSQAEQLITGLERVAATAPAGDMDHIPTEAYRPLNSAQKVRWVPPPPGFMTGDTFNYLIYREKDLVTP